MESLPQRGLKKKKTLKTAFVWNIHANLSYFLCTQDHAGHTVSNMTFDAQATVAKARITVGEHIHGSHMPFIERSANSITIAPTVPL